MAQAPEKEDKKQWAKVQIYMPNHIWTGYVYCPDQRRLLDVLNGIPMGVQGVYADQFLPVSEAKMRSPDEEEATVQSALINKASILFLKEIEGEHRGLGSQAGHKPYPYVSKPSTTAVKLYMPLYTLTGRIQCTERKRVVDVVNSELRFFALTSVEICPLAGSSESGVSFVAVNKGQVLSLAEL